MGKPNRPESVRKHDEGNGKWNDASGAGAGAAKAPLPPVQPVPRASAPGWTPTPYADLSPMDTGRGTIPGADGFQE